MKLLLANANATNLFRLTPMALENRNSVGRNVGCILTAALKRTKNVLFLLDDGDPYGRGPFG